MVIASLVAAAAAIALVVRLWGIVHHRHDDPHGIMSERWLSEYRASNPP